MLQSLPTADQILVVVVLYGVEQTQWWRRFRHIHIISCRAHKHALQLHLRVHVLYGKA